MPLQQDVKLKKQLLKTEFFGKSRKNKLRSDFQFSCLKMFFFFVLPFNFGKVNTGRCNVFRVFDIYSRVVTHLLELRVLYNLLTANARFSITGKPRFRVGDILREDQRE